MKKRILSILLILCMVLMQLPSTVFAETETKAQVETETETKAEVESETEVETETEIETTAESESEMKVETTAESETETKKETKAKAKSKVKSKSVATQTLVKYDLVINSEGFYSDFLELKGDTGTATYNPSTKTLTYYRRTLVTLVVS